MAEPRTPDLPDDALDALLRYAAAVACAAVTGEPAPRPPAVPALSERRGVFVSLHRRGHLRGCLGHIHADLPLVEATAVMAAAVTREDPRFHPVGSDELDGLEVEVSVLSPFVPIAAEDIVAGRHGLMLRRGRSAGLLLPQVATEHGFDRAMFLEVLCEKAGLPAGAWSEPGAELSAFTVQRAELTVRP